MTNDWFDSSYEDIDKLIHKVAWQELKAVGGNPQDLPDLVQAGWIGALNARKSYKSTGHKFSTYAFRGITWKIRDEIATMRSVISKATGGTDYIDLNNEDELEYANEKFTNAFTNGRDLLDDLILRDALDVPDIGFVVASAHIGLYDREVREQTGQVATTRRRNARDEIAKRLSS